MIKLVALQRIIDGVGTIDAGQEFMVDDQSAEKMIADGVARFPGWARREGARWLGAQFVSIASGPSLTEDDVKLVRVWRDADPDMRKVIVVNTTFRLAPWADVLYSADNDWWGNYYQEAASTFKGELWSVESEKNDTRLNVKRFKPAFGNGLCQLPNTINSGGNSGYQALGAAHIWGASRIVLLGYDMQLTAGKTHWHGDHPKPLRQPRQFGRWVAAFNHIAHDFRVIGVEVVNCSRDTALTCFPREELDRALGFRINGHGAHDGE